MAFAGDSRGSSPAVAFEYLLAPVVVLGVARNEELGGMTAAWVTRVSNQPPLVLAAVGHRRYTHELLTTVDAFTISILGEDQAATGRLFGLHGRRERDKWAEVEHVLMGAGVPALARCSARMLCAVRDRLPLGDHTGFVGEVVLGEVVSGDRPLPLRLDDYRL